MSLLTILFQFIVVFIAVVYFPGLPPYIEYDQESLRPTLPYTGALSLNNRLNNAENLYSGLVDGPECLVFKDGVLYTGLNGGKLVEIKNGIVSTLFEFGEQCDGFHIEKCGRPLGLKFDKNGFLYVTDTYLGIFKVDVKTKEVKNLVPANKPINGRIPKLFNSVDVAQDGTLYWTDSTSDFPLHECMVAMITKGKGRLFKYDPQTETNEVLMDNLNFANGVALSKDEDFVIVCELVNNRIFRYYLKGPKKGSYDIFVDGLPGMPDNIHSNGRGGFYIPLVIISAANDNSLIRVLHRHPLLSKFIVRSVTLSKMFLQLINSYFSNHYIDYLSYSIYKIVGEILLTSVPNQVQTAIELDENGKIINSFHNTDGTLKLMSDFVEEGDSFYIGSPFTNYIGRVKK